MAKRGEQCYKLEAEMTQFDGPIQCCERYCHLIHSLNTYEDGYSAQSAPSLSKKLTHAAHPTPAYDQVGKTFRVETMNR